MVDKRGAHGLGAFAGKRVRRALVGGHVGGEPLQQRPAVALLALAQSLERGAVADALEVQRLGRPHHLAVGKIGRPAHAGRARQLLARAAKPQRLEVARGIVAAAHVDAEVRALRDHLRQPRHALLGGRRERRRAGLERHASCSFVAFVRAAEQRRERAERRRDDLLQHVADGARDDRAEVELRVVQVAAHRNVEIDAALRIGEQRHHQLERNVEQPARLELLAELHLFEREPVGAHQAAFAQLVAQVGRQAPGLDAIAGELGDIGVEGLELQVAQVRADVGELGRGVEIDGAADARGSVGLHPAGETDAVPARSMHCPGW